LLTKGERRGAHGGRDPAAGRWAGRPSEAFWGRPPADGPFLANPKDHSPANGPLYLALLFREVRDRRALLVAGGSAAVTMALLPVAPAGLPLLAAALVARVALRRG
jgi:hypothetical protein